MRCNRSFQTATPASLTALRVAFRFSLNARFAVTVFVVSRYCQPVQGARERRRQKAENRRQTAGGRRQTAGGRRQEAGGRRQEADGGRQNAAGRRQSAGGRKDERESARDASGHGR